MKHTAPELMKFRRLQRRLGLPRYAVVGLLETLWITTQKNAPRGDIGRFDNEAIAIELDWPGSPDELIEAMIDAEWIDRSTHHRLVVHDWKDHAPRWVHGVAAKMGGIIDETTPTIEADYRGRTIEAIETNDNSATRAHADLPNLTQPNLTNTPLPPKGETLEAKPAVESDPAEPSEPPSPEFCKFVEAWNRTPGVVTCQSLTTKRRKAFRTRCRQDGWLTNAYLALSKFPLKCFEPGSWRPDIDFMLRPDSVTQILEGKYDWTKTDSRARRHDDGSQFDPNRQGDF